MNAETIRQLIETGLPGARATVQGEDGVHFHRAILQRGSRFIGLLPGRGGAKREPGYRADPHWGSP